MSNNKITYNKKDVHERLLDIAKKYTENISEESLKAGAFGYMTEVMSMMIKDSALHKNMLYRESFLNTAVMPKSVYNWAKMFNININKATPAYADIDIIINKSDLDEAIGKKTGKQYKKEYGFSDKDSDLNMFILDRDNPIMAGDYTFSLERSIRIYKTTNSTSGNETYVAEYIMTEPVKTAFQTIKSPSLSLTFRGTSCVIKARVYQYKVVEIVKQIPNNSILNTKTHVYNFDGQFAGLSMSYKRGSDGEKNIDVRYSNINSDETGVFCYYNLNSENELQVTFSNAEDAFLPKSNDTLTARIYITNGTNVPKSFTESTSYNQTDDEFKDYAVIINFNPTNIIGGKDMPSVTKIRDTIINEISSRNVIITESDLNNYFAILTALLESINNGKVTFVKKRDDIMRRLFSAYVLLRDGLADDDVAAESNFVSRCIPTNTIDVDFPISRNTSRAFGTMVKSKNNVLDGYVYTPSADSLNDDYYVIPFYMYISLNPIKRVKYIYNLTDNESPCSFTKILLANNNVGHYIIPNTVHVRRALSAGKASDEYTVEFKFTTNYEMTKYVSRINSGGNNYLSFKKDNVTVGTVMLNDTNNKIVSVKQEDSQDIYDTSIIVTVKVAPSEFDFTNGSTQYMQILTAENTKTDIPESVVFELNVDGLTIDGVNYTFTASGDKHQNLFQSLDSIMASDIIINTEDEPEVSKAQLTSDGKGVTSNKLIKSITIKDVPVVHASYFKRANSDTDSFINQLFTYINILKENIDKLETNTFFDIKFYNTYGSAHIYNSLKTNLDLDLEVVLLDEYKNNEYVKNNIKSYIRRLVDESNKSYNVSVSSIITATNNNFNNYIDHINIYGLNDTGNQYINKIAGVDESQYVPEWLNIQPSSLNDRIKFS